MGTHCTPEDLTKTLPRPSLSCLVYAITVLIMYNSLEESFRKRKSNLNAQLSQRTSHTPGRFRSKNIFIQIRRLKKIINIYWFYSNRSLPVGVLGSVCVFVFCLHFCFQFPDGAGVSQVCWVTGATDLLIALEEYLSRRLPALRCQSVCLQW
ncbi:hypothetical protein ILYODFUR_031237 [Ilyodon furcidens]|uniref:Uncharacterized protein n=1 Tax=Ilyodon furcidens TaxID=33524 RepID=A0ABV0SR11_9TELE